MAGETWSIKVDGGTELNDLVNYVTQIPQWDDIPDFDIKTVPIDGTYPAFIRADPSSGLYTVLIQMTPCTNQVWQTRIAALKAMFSPGIHTLTAQIRGMSSPKSVVIVPRSLAVTDFKLRQVIVTCYVPVPVPA